MIENWRSRIYIAFRNLLHGRSCVYRCHNDVTAGRRGIILSALRRNDWLLS